MQTILSDNKCQELWSLLKSAQSCKNITSQDIVRYRREAERHVGLDDHLYRLQWVSLIISTERALYIYIIRQVRESQCMRIALCSPDEPSVETDGSSMSRWREYVNTYVMSYPTEWLPETQKRSSAVFLQR